MSHTPPFTDTMPDGLPFAVDLIAELRAGRDVAGRQRIIARYPALELLAPVPVLGLWLNMKEQSIYMSRTRKRSDGLLEWPDEDDTVLGRKMWRFSTIALHRASAPGRGWNLRGNAREGAK
jgi:hypothetical protein